MRRLVVAATLVSLAGGLTVLAGVFFKRQARHHTWDPTTALSDQCDEVPSGARRITLTRPGGQLLGGAVVGPADAEVGVVLRQGASQTICDWLPWAGQVAQETGARVLLFDRRGQGSSPGDGNLAAEPADTLAAVELLRGDGAVAVGLVASSMGNSVLFSALPDLAPAPCAIASISPVLVSADASGVLDGTPLDGLPDNVWVTWEEGNDDVAANATDILAAADSAHSLGVDTSDHSIKLVTGHDEVREFLVEAIASCRSHG